MRKAEGRRAGEGGRGAGRACALLGAFCVLAASGCQLANERAAGANDPLLGGLPPRAAAAAATGQPRAATPPASSTSTAALASNPKQALDPDRELRIPGGRDKAAAAGGDAKTPPGGVALQPPQPAAPDPAMRQVSAVVPVGGARAAGLEQGLAQLRARGAVFYRLEAAADNGECLLTCSIPSRQNPNVRRTYEARAADEPTALRLVLDQIDREQR
jgi:hypothetical protein